MADKDAKMQKTTQWLIVSMTVVYVILFPVFLFASLMSVTIFENYSAGIRLWGFLFLLAIPCGIPLSLTWMWRRYLQKKYLQARLYSIMPIVIGTASGFIIEAMRHFAKHG